MFRGLIDTNRVHGPSLSDVVDDRLYNRTEIFPCFICFWLLDQMTKYLGTPTVSYLKAFVLPPLHVRPEQ